MIDIISIRKMILLSILYFFLQTSGNEKSLNNQQLDLIRTLLLSNDSQLDKYSLETILSTLWTIPKLCILLRTKCRLWEVIQTHRPIRSFEIKHFKLIEPILPSIPEYSLFRINTSDWGVIKYFGRYPYFNRRQMSILANAVASKWGARILSEYELLNELGGITCGFRITQMKKITAAVILLMKRTIFYYYSSCNHNQLRVLLEVVMDTNCLGPPQTWNDRAVNQLGMLFAGLHDYEMIELRPESLRLLRANVILKMNRKQLRGFTYEQYSMLNYNASIAFAEKMDMDHINKIRLDHMSLT